MNGKILRSGTIKAAASSDDMVPGSYNASPFYYSEMLDFGSDAIMTEEELDNELEMMSWNL